MLFTKSNSIVRIRRGMTLLYATICMAVLCGMASFAIDLGRMQAAKTELQRAADAAARYAATGLPDHSAVSKAITSASENNVDGTPLILLDGDVTMGTWANGVFTAGGASPNAVRVVAKRSSARGNAVPLLFAQILGMGGGEVSATSIAAYNPSLPYGIVGLDFVSLSGNSLDSYMSSGGSNSFSTSPMRRAIVASNGGISLSGGATIDGDAHPGVGNTVSTSGGSSVTGSTAPLTSPLSYASVSLGTVTTNNNNANISPVNLNPVGNDFTLSGGGGSISIAGGTYYVNDFTVSGGTLNFTGPVTLYVDGKLTISGNGVIVTAGSIPANLSIQMASSSTATLSGGARIFAQVYAPDSAVTLSGSSGLAGQVVGKSVTMSGGATIYTDNSLSAQIKVTTVK
jgi:hypothetical protein